MTLKQQWLYLNLLAYMKQLLHPISCERCREL